MLSWWGKAITPVFSPNGYRQGQLARHGRFIHRSFCQGSGRGTLTDSMGNWTPRKVGTLESRAELLAALQSIPEAFSGLAES